MTIAAPTFSQIKAQVSAIRQHSRNTRIIGIQTTGRWSGETYQQDGSDTYVIQQCDSPLALRQAIRDRDPSITVQVLLTSLSEEELGTDILLRLAKQRLFKVNSWQIVQSLFQATSIDPRLACRSFLANYLMDWAPLSGYPPVPGGFLDAETAWSVLLDYGIGLKSDRPDLLTVLKWSIHPDNIERYQRSPADFQLALTEWLTQTAGSTAQPVLQCILLNEKPDALAIGLVLDVLFNSEVEQQLDRAIGKLEVGYLGGTAPNLTQIQKWSTSALEVLRLQMPDPQQKAKILDRLDEILYSINAEAFAYLSDVSPLGFQQRLTRFAGCLKRIAKQPTDEALTELTQLLHSIKEHDQSKIPSERRRLERLEMALRLARWLIQSSTPTLKSFNEAVQFHVQEGSFLDWARLCLRGGEPVRALSEAFSVLFEAITLDREKQAKQFAELLKSWTELGSSEQLTFTPVESILDTIVAPLMDYAPVLLIVMDGMSTAVCRELMASITKGYDWTLITPHQSSTALLTGLAAMPSVTNVSRASLLCGQLKQGDLREEQKGFTTHSALANRCRSGLPPILFHKPALRASEDPLLADEVRQAIESPQHRIVGVVVNAIDDHLSKGEQIDVAWNLDNIRILSTLLYEAKQSQRLVVVLSDHGHILEHNTSYQPGSGNERWRDADASVAVGELQVQGNRLLTSQPLIAPWTETIRYIKAKKNGYHGGLNPQEMLIPIAVLCSTSTLPDQWIEAPADHPLWWDTTAVIHPKLSLPQSTLPLPQPDLGPLFSFASEQPAKSWIASLLDSPLYHVQQKKAGRSALSDEAAHHILTVLDAHNHSISLVTLASSLSISVKQMQGYLVKLQRSLNIDGYQILTYAPHSTIVELKLSLLYQQFNLG